MVGIHKLNHNICIWYLTWSIFNEVTKYRRWCIFIASHIVKCVQTKQLINLKENQFIIAIMWDVADKIAKSSHRLAVTERWKNTTNNLRLVMTDSHIVLESLCFLFFIFHSHPCPVVDVVVCSCLLFWLRMRVIFGVILTPTQATSSFNSNVYQCSSQPHSENKCGIKLHLWRNSCQENYLIEFWNDDRDFAVFFGARGQVHGSTVMYQQSTHSCRTISKLPQYQHNISQAY